MIADWLVAENLRPFLETLGRFVGHDFDHDDWTAIRHGIRGTEHDEDRWYDYELTGRLRVSIRLAGDSGTSVVHVQVEAPRVVIPKVEASLAIFQHFRVQPEAQ